MTAVFVFDPAMCCSTGVCGPAVDPQLARFAADLDWLKSQGVSVERFNLARQPAAFAEDQAVRSALETNGSACLPVVKVNGEIKSTGLYPSREQLAWWAGIGGPASNLFTEGVAERIAIREAPDWLSGPIMLKTASSGCCAPAAREPGDRPAPTKSRRCC